jgi:hypothetical protein
MDHSLADDYRPALRGLFALAEEKLSSCAVKREISR